MLCFLAALVAYDAAPAWRPVSEAGQLQAGERCRRRLRRRRAAYARPANYATQQPAAVAAASPWAWRSLFDGKSLDGWKITNFGGEGEVRAEQGELILEMGYSLTGVTWDRDFPKSNYEIRLQAKRTQGDDFFCGLTMPVKDSFCTFIVGGWAGAVVGISSIDGADASENPTSAFMNFQNDQWYNIRVRVTDDKILCWIDDDNVVEQDLVGRRVSTRSEVDLSKPMGVSTWETAAALRNIRYRRLAPDER
jgi:hypothetical protein